MMARFGHAWPEEWPSRTAVAGDTLGYFLGPDERARHTTSPRTVTLLASQPPRHLQCGPGREEAIFRAGGGFCRRHREEQPIASRGHKALARAPARLPPTAGRHRRYRAKRRAARPAGNDASKPRSEIRDFTARAAHFYEAQSGFYRRSWPTPSRGRELDDAYHGSVRSRRMRDTVPVRQAFLARGASISEFRWPMLAPLIPARPRRWQTRRFRPDAISSLMMMKTATIFCSKSTTPPVLRPPLQYVTPRRYDASMRTRPEVRPPVDAEPSRRGFRGQKGDTSLPGLPPHASSRPRRILSIIAWPDSEKLPAAFHH